GLSQHTSAFKTDLIAWEARNEWVKPLQWMDRLGRHAHISIVDSSENIFPHSYTILKRSTVDYLKKMGLHHLLNSMSDYCGFDLSELKYEYAWKSMDWKSLSYAELSSVPESSLLDS